MSSTVPLSFSRRVVRVLSEPERLTRVFRRYQHQYLFRRLALRSQPVPVPASSDAEVHVLFGHSRVLSAIATLKSLYRFLPTPYALVVHDDGSLTSSDRALVEAHFPGFRLIPRAVADQEVLGELRRRDLMRCARLREELIFALKLFDLQFYGQGRALLYVDTDILFLHEPTELISALSKSPDEWVDRYNEDIHSGYAWPAEEIQRHTSISMLPCINAGMLCIRRDELDWEFYEQCLAMPGLRAQYYAEQTLNAIDISRRGGMPLPPEYDVAFRYAHRGDYSQWLARAPNAHEVITQHYCGSQVHVAYYFEHYVRHVAPVLA